MRLRGRDSNPNFLIQSPTAAVQTVSSRPSRPQGAMVEPIPVEGVHSVQRVSRSSLEGLLEVKALPRGLEPTNVTAARLCKTVAW